MSVLETGACFLSIFFDAVGWAVIASVYELIVAHRQQIFCGNLRGTQSCIVRDGFGAGLGQSDRERREIGQNIAREVRDIKYSVRKWKSKYMLEVKKLQKTIQQGHTEAADLNEWHGSEQVEGQTQVAHQWRIN